MENNQFIKDQKSIQIVPIEDQNINELIRMHQEHFGQKYHDNAYHEICNGFLLNGFMVVDYNDSSNINIKSGGTKVEDTLVKNTNADEVNVDEANADEVKADEVKADEVKADEVKADEVKADEVKADEVKADETNIDVNNVRSEITKRYIGETVVRWEALNGKMVLYIFSFSVDEDYRRKGIGSKMMEYVINNSSDAEIFYLHTSVNNLPAQNLYKKYGFVPHHVIPKYYREDNEDGLVMVKYNEYPSYPQNHIHIYEYFLMTGQISNDYAYGEQIEEPKFIDSEDYDETELESISEI